MLFYKDFLQVNGCVSKVLILFNAYYYCLDSGWGLWTSWSTCSKNCGPGQQGRKRLCMPYQHPELIKGLKSGKISRTDYYGFGITCHEKDQKESQSCSNGPCDSVGWTKNKETGREGEREIEK